MEFRAHNADGNLRSVQTPRKTEVEPWPESNLPRSLAGEKAPVTTPASPATGIRRAMLLAAGRGERLRPLTEALPKPLLPLLGRPIISYVLEALRAAGIERVVLNQHHHGDLLRRFVGDGEAWGMEVAYSSERRLLGTAGGLKHAARQLGSATFLVLNADLLLRLEPEAWLAVHRRHAALATLVLRRDADAERYGSISLRADGRIGRFLATRAPDAEAGGDAGEALMFTGATLMEPAFLDHIPARRRCDISGEVYPALLSGGLPLAGVRYDGYWLDLGVPGRYLQAHWDLLEGRAPGLAGNPSAVSAETLRNAGVEVTAPIWVAPGCRIAAGVALGPNVVLGAGCRLAPRARLVGTVAWEQVHIGAGAVVRGSILATKARVPAGARLEEAIVPGA